MFEQSLSKNYSSVKHPNPHRTKQNRTQNGTEPELNLSVFAKNSNRSELFGMT